MFITWASSQYLAEDFNQPPLKLSGNSLRQTVHTSVGGKKISVNFSNLVGKTNLEIQAVHIAKTISPEKIDKSTEKVLTFNGSKDCIIPPGADLWSDELEFSFNSLDCLTVTMYMGAVPLELTGHMGSRTHSYIMQNNHLSDEVFDDKYSCEHWYFLAGIKVLDNIPVKVLACLGDSITDGRGSTTDLQNRWTDILSEKLLGSEKNNNIAVINEGIGGTCIMFSGVERFQRDVLSLDGINACFILYGINDIIYANANKEQLINTYKSLISKAKKEGLVVFGGTILPFGNHSDYRIEKDNVRRDINEWILNTLPEDGGFDATVDLATVMTDDSDPSKMKRNYDCGDGLHPSAEGYRTMGQAIFCLFK